MLLSFVCVFPFFSSNPYFFLSLALRSECVQRLTLSLHVHRSPLHLLRKEHSDLCFFFPLSSLFCLNYLVFLIVSLNASLEFTFLPPILFIHFFYLFTELPPFHVIFTKGGLTYVTIATRRCSHDSDRSIKLHPCTRHELL